MVTGVDQYIKENWRLWKLRKIGGSKKDYLAAKKFAKGVIYNVKKVAQETQFTEMNTEKDYNKIFKLAKKMKVYDTDVIGNKCVKDKDNNLVLGYKEKLRVWKTHYEQLLNVDSIGMIVHNL